MGHLRVLLSTLVASDSAVHGGPVVAWRHALALAKVGAEVHLVAPEIAIELAPQLFKVERYSSSGPNGQFVTRRPDAQAVLGIAAIIDRFKPHLVYDVHGPAWAVDAAANRGVPIVSMVGDYGWFCRLNSCLVDSKSKRCSGPDSTAKCFQCANRRQRVRWRALNTLLMAKSSLWSEIAESQDYCAAMLEKVTAFVIGDLQAERVFREHGVEPRKLIRLAQGLPDELLIARRSDDGKVPGIDRPIRIGFVARLHPEKGFHVLAKAFESLAQEPNVELWIAHSEYAKPDIVERHFADRRRFRSHLRSGRVRLFQPRSREELLRTMAEMDVGVVPSLAYESPSLALLEFVSQKTPVIRSESDGMSHVIQDSINGRTFSYGDSEALATVLRDLIAEPALLMQWREKLPAIGSDVNYARQLLEHFTQLVTVQEKNQRESIHVQGTHFERPPDRDRCHGDIQLGALHS